MRIALFLAEMLFWAVSLQASNEPHKFKIDYLCCGEYVKITPQYSNAVLKAVLPYFTDYARKLDLPVHLPIKTSQVERFVPMPKIRREDQIEASCVLTNGFVFGFRDGFVTGFINPHAYSILQDPQKVPLYYGTPRVTKDEAVALARKTITRLGFSLEDVLADTEPDIPPFETVGTNVVAVYKIQWLDPRSGSKFSEVEINAISKTVELIYFPEILALRRPGPRVDVKPGVLKPDEEMGRMNALGDFMNHEYAWRLVPVVFKAAENWGKTFGLNMPVPISTNQVKRFYASNNGGSPYVEVTLTNDWHFVYQHRDIVRFRSPRCFFDSDNLPFRLKNYLGKWNFSKEQAVEIARQAVAKLGHPTGFDHTEVKPRITQPNEINGVAAIPRLRIEWIYPSPQTARQQWIDVEVDCDQGTVEMFMFNDVRLWGNPPDLGVPILPPNPARK
jgi:hypothetical protein